MSAVLWRTGWSYLRRHVGNTLLMVLGIALGVAVVVGIDLANSAAGHAFDLSAETIAGRATHQIVGGPGGLDESLYTALRVQAGVQAAAPVVSDYVTSPRLGNRPVQLLGVDPFAEAPFRSYLAATSRPRAGTGTAQPASDAVSMPVDGLVAFLTRPGAVLLSEGMAARYGIAVGDSLALEIGGRRAQAQVVGLLHTQDSLSQRALDDQLLADIATAQELTGRLGRLDHIDLILPPGDSPLADAVARLLPPGVQVVPAGARAGAVAQMTAAFRTNLLALSLLALVVGMFLIYNSMTFSVVQRRPLFGVLRCLGVTWQEIAGLVLLEAVLVGAAGSALGLALGVLLGQGAVRLVTQTINDLYYVVSVRGVQLPLASLAKGAALGMLATVGTTALPAWEAAAVPPRLTLARSGLEDAARRTVPLAGLAGLALLLIGAALLAIPTRNLGISFAALFPVVIGFAGLAPGVTLGLLRLALPLSGRAFGVLGRMAPRSIAGALSRTALAIAALMVAVSVTIGVGLMVGSFRSTVVAWLGETLRSDIYISAPSLTSARTSAALDPAIQAIAAAWPGVRGAEGLRAVDVLSPAGPIAVSAVTSPSFAAQRIFVSTDGGRAAAIEAVRSGAVLASEALANRLGLPARGASLTLYTDRGPHAFPVAGVYRDYSSSQGTVMMAAGLYRTYWDDGVVTAVSLELEPGADVDQVAAGLAQRLDAIQGVQVRPNRALRAEVLEVFDRAFAITVALQFLAAIVAFIGVLSALLALQLERAHELGILRAVGLTVRQLRGLVLLETGLMGAAAGLLAMPTGLVLAYILIYIINRRSFGWTMQLQLSPHIFAEALLLSVGAALLAGVYPAWRMGRMLAAEALRGE